ncbi:acyltransferase family protein [Umezawaea tangerina]|uniref:Peptidoglycan/LPS O-acetylase OafA/YrhL n=1 Tax=Umezawaea tangerina TaxID=84725 RepID=A0A2T0T1K0_9PSEU|nr:acyltransferase [Umezawaea tangerina]PRY39555.1 peptidoglycan/LPS O-acetylase OafA/YrhL [Umezawaea tangerina]
MQTLTHDEFLAARRFPGLDGLRAVAATMVVLFHFGGPEVLQGWIGVHLFFVLSGFLITTLLLREHQRAGRVSLPEFYLRRAFRILPVYLVVLVLTVTGCLLAGTFGSSGMAASLPLQLTFLNEFTQNNPFGHSWTLGTEEKFYLCWPLLAFVGAVSTARRLLVAVAGLVLALALLPVTLPQSTPNWTLGYFSILAGCLLAVVMHHPRGFALVRPLTHPLVALGIGVAFVGAHLSVAACAGLLGGWLHMPGHIAVTPVYAVAAAFLLPAVLARGPVRWVLSTRPMAFVGARSYSVYLVQNFAGLAVALLPVAGAARTALVCAVALAMAHLAHRLVEQPMIAVGRGLVERRRLRLAGTPRDELVGA